MSDDMSFCMDECEHTECERHPSNIVERSIPHSYMHFRGTEFCEKKPRYIDADALLNELEDLIRARLDWISDGRNEIQGLNVAICTVEEQPTADVIPIEWIKEQKDKCFPYSSTALVLNGLITEWERRKDARNGES